MYPTKLPPVCITKLLNALDSNSLLVRFLSAASNTAEKHNTFTKQYVHWSTCWLSSDTQGTCRHNFMCQAALKRTLWVPLGSHIQKLLRVRTGPWAGAGEMLAPGSSGVLFSSHTSECSYTLTPSQFSNPVMLKYVRVSPNSVTVLGTLYPSSVLNSKRHLLAACCPIQGPFQIPMAYLVAAFHPSRSLSCYHGHPLGTWLLSPQTLQNPIHWHQFVFQRPDSKCLLGPFRWSQIYSHCLGSLSVSKQPLDPDGTTAPATFQAQVPEAARQTPILSATCLPDKLPFSMWLCCCHFPPSPPPTSPRASLNMTAI